MSVVARSEEPLDRDELEYFRNLLEERRQALLSNADQTVEGMSGIAPQFPDPTDRAALESGRNFDLRIRDRERKLIHKIAEALGRIADGSFGLCEECGYRISTGRLEARPVTTLCIECKERQEAAERNGG